MTLSRFALLLTLATLPLFAQPGPRPGQPGPRGEQRLERMAEHLKLTEAQKAKFKDLHARHREANETKVKAAQEARKAFHQASRAKGTPEAQLRTLHRNMADLQFELLLSRRALREQVDALLTPEQRVEAEKMHAFRQGMAAGRRGGRGPQGF